MYELILKPKGFDDITVPLQSYEKDLLSHENINGLKVYADVEYDIAIVENTDVALASNQKINVAEVEKTDILNHKISKDDDNFSSAIRKYSIYVNDEKLETYGPADNITLVDKKIFSDSFGFARITVEIQYIDGTEATYFSDYVSIMVNDVETVKRINTMYEYIFENQQELLFKQNFVDDSINSKSKAGSVNNSRTQNGNDSVLTKLAIAEDIARLFENSFGYFRTNSRYKIKERYVVDDVEKLRNITSKTLDYIAGHPEQLSPAAGNSGIRINGQGYLPKKTLIQENEISVDIYENQVIVGFLYRIIADLMAIKSKLDSLESSIKSNSPKMDTITNDAEMALGNGKYVHSAQLILSKTENIVLDKKEKLSSLLEKFQGLLNMYSSILKVSKLDVQTIPKPTAIFMSIPTYNLVFNGICRWFSYVTEKQEISSNLDDKNDTTAGREEAFMLSFVNLASLYELYALCRLINDVKEQGYTLEFSEKYEYKVNNNSYYVNSDCVNTFVFRNDTDDQLTIYYQPVIYKGGHRNNRTGLYRNISLSFSENGYRGEYYVPDYVIKKTSNGKSKYAILDAKFMSCKNAIYKVPELSYKYLFSLSTIEPRDSIEGLYILYGKPEQDEHMKSAYDFEIVENSIQPRVQMVPLGVSGITNEF